jgi:hypothetical protein
MPGRYFKLVATKVRRAADGEAGAAIFSERPSYRVPITGSRSLASSGIGRPWLVTPPPDERSFVAGVAIVVAGWHAVEQRRRPRRRLRGHSLRAEARGRDDVQLGATAAAIVAPLVKLTPRQLARSLGVQLVHVVEHAECPCVGRACALVGRQCPRLRRGHCRVVLAPARGEARANDEAEGASCGLLEL